GGSHGKPNHAVAEIIEQDALVEEFPGLPENLQRSRQEHPRKDLQPDDEGPQQDQGQEGEERRCARPLGGPADVITPEGLQRRHDCWTIPQRSIVRRSSGARSRRSRSSQMMPMTIIAKTITSVR